MGRQSVHYSVHDLLGERRRIGELRLGIIVGLKDQFLRLQQLSLDHVVDVDELIIVGEIAFKQVIYLGDDLGQPRLFLLVD
jgi:hypothetical protein